MAERIGRRIEQRGAETVVGAGLKAIRSADSPAKATRTESAAASTGIPAAARTAARSEAGEPIGERPGLTGLTELTFAKSELTTAERLEAIGQLIAIDLDHAAVDGDRLERRVERESGWQQPRGGIVFAIHG